MDQNIYKLVYKVTHAGGSGSCFYLKSYNLSSKKQIRPPPSLSA